MKNWRITNKALVGFLLGLMGLVALFWIFGVSVWKGSSGHSLFWWLYIMWAGESTEAVDYSHGLIIPFVSLWLLWRKREALRQVFAKPVPHGIGLVLWSVGIALHFAGLRMQIPHLSALAFVVSLWALVWTFVGIQAARLILFPLAFLGFAIPISFLAQATFPLRLVGSVAAAAILNGFGIATTRVGTAVYSTAGQGFAMDVADACSGIRSIMALMALTAAFAYIFRKNNFERWFLFLMSVPIAAAANVGRIVTIALVALLFGQEFGMKVYHDWSGYFVFVLTVLLVVAVSKAMDRLQAMRARLKGEITEIRARPNALPSVAGDANKARSRFPVYGLFWGVLLVAAVPLLHLAAKVKPADPLPAHWMLPDAFEGWQGETLYYSTDPNVTQSFRAADIVEPGVCPVGGAPLDTVPVAERRLLPADVEIERRLYSNQQGLQRLAIMVVSGESREGIHRPEWCLTAQGVRIGLLRTVKVRDAQSHPFEVAVYPMFPKSAPEQAPPTRFFVYWFEGPGAKTPHNLVRILRMGWDRLRYGRVQRWAYFSIQLNLAPGRGGADAQIADAVDWLMHGRMAASEEIPSL